MWGWCKRLRSSQDSSHRDLPVRGRGIRRQSIHLQEPQHRMCSHDNPRGPGSSHHIVWHIQVHGVLQSHSVCLRSHSVQGLYYHMSRDGRKTVFKVSEQVQHKQVCAVIFKYMACYSLTQFVSVLILYKFCISILIVTRDNRSSRFPIRSDTNRSCAVIENG